MIFIQLPGCIKIKGGFVMSDINTLSHTTWRCNFHIEFAPKYRRMVLYGKIKEDIEKF